MVPVPGQVCAVPYHPDRRDRLDLSRQCEGVMLSRHQQGDGLETLPEPERAVPSTRQSGILQGDRSGLVQSHNQVQEMSAGIIARLCPRFMCPRFISRGP